MKEKLKPILHDTSKKVKLHYDMIFDVTIPTFSVRGQIVNILKLFRPYIVSVRRDGEGDCGVS